MAQFDLHNNIKDFVALNIGTISTSTTTNGNVIDTKGFESTEFEIISGVITDGTYVPAIYESDDAAFSTGVTAIPTDLLIGTINVTGTAPSYGSPVVDPYADATFVAADDNKVARVGCLNKKRYIRLSITSSGVTSGGILGALATLSHPLEGPTAKDK